MSAAQIPIRNIYYLFCYAWQQFDQAEALGVDAEKSPDIPNLLAKVLIQGTKTLLRRGLDRNYKAHTDQLATVRGRIDLSTSIQLQACNLRRIQCEYDEFSYDVLHNRILKASMIQLARAKSISMDLARELRRLIDRFPHITDIELRNQHFSQVQIHRNNVFYGFLLNICRLAHDCLLPIPGKGEYKFEDILRNEQKMARVFEAFVREFFRREQTFFKVEPLTLNWGAEEVCAPGLGRLPSMRVDVFLRSADRSIILDTKYYVSALQEYYGTKSYHSGHLYQIFSYLINSREFVRSGPAAEGILLYPVNGFTLNERYRVHGHSLTLATVDLSKPWQEIESRMKDLLSEPMKEQGMDWARQ